MTRKKKNEDLYDNGFCDVCVCAVRYSLGRRTYMPSLVTSYISKHLDKFNDNQLSILERDIFEHGRSYIPVHNDFGYTTLELGDLNREAYGDSCDFDTWMNFLDTIRKELDKRKEAANEKEASGST